MPPLQEINAAYSPDSKWLQWDPDLKLSCLDFEKKISNSLGKELSDQVDISFSEKNEDKTIADKLSQLLEPFSYPTIYEYAELAARVYAYQKQGELNQELPEGWELLTTASNNGIIGPVLKTNGYFGAAYWHVKKQQVVMAHCGTVIWNIGAWRTNFQSIVSNQHTPQIDSAVTFAYQVAKVIQRINHDKRNPKLNIQLSFTGHSLGGWLAQITTFTTKYLKLVENAYFLKDEDFQKNGLHPRTVVFDNPGGQKILFSLRDKLDIRYGQCHNGRDSLFLDNLDITTYLSVPNLVNTCNRHVGTLYRVPIDLSDKQQSVDIPLYYTAVTHKMRRIKEAIKALAVSDAMTKPGLLRILDWPLLGKRSPTHSEGFLEYALDLLVAAVGYAVQNSLSYLPIDPFSFAYQKYKYTKEYTEIFEFLKKTNAFHVSQEALLNPSGYIKIRYQAEAVGIKDNNKCPRNVFTSAEWQFLVWYQILSDQSNLSSISDILSSKVFEGNEPITTKAITFLKRFRINKEIITVNEGTVDEFIAYVKHLLHLFPKLSSDELINASNMRYQLESFLYLQSNLMDFFKEDIQQRASQARHERSHFEKKPIDLKDFLENKKYKILHTIQSDLNIGVNVIYDLYRAWLKENASGEERYAFFNLEHLLNLKFSNLSDFLTNKTSNRNDAHPNHPYLLVIECESRAEDMSGAEQKLFAEKKFFKDLFGILEKHSHLKLILVGQEDSLSNLIYEEASREFAELFIELYQQKLLKIEFNDLTEFAKDKLLMREVIVQGEEIALDKLIIRQDASIKDVINSEILAALIKNEKIEVGIPVPLLGEIKDYYIDRQFYHQVKLKQDVLLEYPGDKFFIVNRGDKDSLLTWAKTQRVKSIAAIKPAPHQYRDTQFVLAEDTQIAKDDFKYLCAQDSSQIIHWLEKEANGDLIWLQSQGSVSGLRKYLDQSRQDLLEDKQLIDGESGNKVVIIAAEPGMGKSTTLTYLANQQKEKNIFKWVLRVDLPKCKERLNQNSFKKPDDVISFLYDINSTINGLSKKLLEYFVINKGNTVLLLDGFDEIEKNEQDKVIDLIAELKKTNVEKVIVSTRFHEREVLENKLSVFSYTFEPFTEKDQSKFLERFWTKNLDINTKEKEILLKKYIIHFLTSFSDSDSISNAAAGFMGIPLQTKMMAEIFQSDIQRSLKYGDKPFNTIENFGILELYERFIHYKYDLYMQEKRGMGVLLDPMEKNEWTASFTKMHRRLAMSLLFPGVRKDMQVLLGNKLLQDHGKIEKLNLIGIFQIIAHKVDVMHRSYAEYFAADFLGNSLQKKHNPKKYKHAISFLSKEIFKPECEVISIFLDSFLTSRATRYEECLAGIKHKLIGIPHDISIKALVSSLHNTTANTAEGKGFSELNELIKQLLEKLEVGQLDAKKINVFLTKIRNCVNTLSKSAFFNRRLRYTANEANLDAVNELLKNPEIDVDDTDNLGRTALHYAAQKGNKKIVSALLEKGFKIEALDACARSAIHYAARYNAQDTKTIGCLLAHVSEAIINTVDKQGFTPLNYALKQGYWHLVSALIKKGVKPDEVLNKGELLFHFIFENDLATIQTILSNINVNDLNQYRDQQQNGLLHIAAQRGFTQIVGLLLEQGIEVQARNKYAQRPIHIAARNTHWQIVTRLLINDKPNSADFNDLNDTEKDSFLEYFKENKSLLSLPTLKFFFEDSNKRKYFNAFNLNEQEKIDFFCQFVDSGGDLGIIMLFIDQGTEIDKPDRIGKKPIQYAAEQKYWDIAKLLLIKKAALLDNLSEEDTNSLFNYSVKHTHWKMVEFLLIKKVALLDNLSEEDAGSLFNYFAEHAHWNIIRIFIEGANGQDYLFKRLTAQQRRNCFEHLIFVGEGELAAKKAFIDTLMEKRIDINSQDEDGKTLLHRAVQYQQSAIVSYLVKDKQADLQVKDNDQRTPLHLAAQNSCLEMVKCLAEHDTNVKREDKEGRTALYYTLKNTPANLEVVKYLLEKTVGYELLNKLHYVAGQGYKALLETLLTEEGADINAGDDAGVTLLHQAAANGHPAVAKLLIEKGALLSTRSDRGVTPLDLAAEKGHQVVVELLIQNGAKVKAEVGGDKRTPLHLAAEKGHQAVAELLLKKGAKVNARNVFGITPLYLAAEKGHQAVAKLLIEKGAWINARNDYALTPLHQAAEKGHEAIAKLLIKNKADVNAKAGGDKWTPLHQAAANGHQAVAKQLIENGADVNVGNAFGVTGLHLAAQNGHQAVVERLIDNKADVNAVAAKEKCTPLHQAAANGHQAVVERLIKSGANVNAINVFGVTGLHLAAKNVHQAVVERLIENGANVNARNAFNVTPLHLAAKYAYLEMVEYLVEQGADIQCKDEDDMTPFDRAKAIQYVDESKYQPIVSFLRLAAEKSHRKSASSLANVTFFQGKKSDDEPQCQSHGTQPAHYSGGKN